MLTQGAKRPEPQRKYLLQLHDDGFGAEGDLVTHEEFFAAAGFDCTVEENVAILDRGLNFATGAAESGKFQELAELDGDGADFDDARSGGAAGGCHLGAAIFFLGAAASGLMI